MVEVGAERGISAETCLEGTGVELGATQVCGAQELHVATNLVKAAGGTPGLGVAVGQKVGLRAYGVWGFALLTSPNLAHASEIGLHYLPLTYAVTGLRLEITADQVRLIIEDTDPFLVEREIATVTGIVRALLGESPRTMRVELRLPPETDYESALRTPVTYQARHNALVADAAILRQPLPHADPMTMAACERACRTLVERRSPTTTRSVRTIVAEGVTDTDAIAARLHLSPRTLRRRLAAEHTSLRRLVEEIRRATASDLLGRDLSVEQIAARLGYTDAATFIRAFRRWTGTTPGAYREAAHCATGSR